MADGKVEGLRLADPALRRALGSRAAFTLRAASGPDGVIDVVGAAPRFRDGAGALCRPASARTRSPAPSMRRCRTSRSSRASPGAASPAASRPRRDSSGDPARKAVAADLTVTTAGLVTGVAAADRVLGRAPTLQGRVSQSYDGYGFDHLRLEGAGLTATLQGTATTAAADVAGRLDLKSLADLDGRLTGRAGLDAPAHRLPGTSRPDGDADGAGRHGGRQAGPGPAGRGRAQGCPARARTAAVRVSGDVAGKALTGGAHGARRGADWVLDRLGLNLGSVASPATPRSPPRRGSPPDRSRCAPASLEDVAPLAPEPMPGRLDADRDPGPRRRPAGRGDPGDRGGPALRRLRPDPPRRGPEGPRSAGPPGPRRAPGRRPAVAAGQQIDTVRLAAAGSPAFSDVTLTAKARGFDLDGAAGSCRPTRRASRSSACRPPAGTTASP